MRDFVKWLGVSEKVAKVVVWLLIIMVMLILTNTLLGSLGFTNYQITYDNLVRININKTINTTLSFVVTILNFYTITLLVFRVKESKRMIKYALLYFLLNLAITTFLGYVAVEIFILIYMVVFCYLYSNRNWKYIVYCIMAMVLDTAIQGVWYSVKMKSIDYNSLSIATKSSLMLDYFIIMGVIILVKEIYLKKRGEKICSQEDLHAGSGSANSKKKANSLKK